MAKELPYFQFEPAEYLTKDVSFCTLSAQGLFINLCSYYWQRNCELTKQQLLRRLPHEEEFNELISEGVIEYDQETDVIKVKFLDNQRDKAINKSNINSKNGAKGGRPRKQKESESKPKQNPTKSESKGIRKDKIIKEDIKEDKKTIFETWLSYRKEQKKEIKNSKTLESLVKRFNLESLNKCEWVVNNSIENGYQGLFWDNYKPTQKTTTINTNKRANYF